MRKVVILVEGRSKKLFVGGDDVAALRESFQELCAHDPVLKARIETHYPTFYSCSKDDDSIELEDEEELTDGQKVRFFFAAFAAVETQGRSVDFAGPSNNGRQGVTQASSTDQQELGYLRKIGMRVPTNETVSNCNATHLSLPPASTNKSGQSMSSKNKGSTTTKTSNGNKKSKQGPSKSPTLTLETDDSDSGDDSYLKESHAARQRNLSVMKELNLIESNRVILKPKRNKKAQQKKGDAGDENIRKTRTQPRRAVKISTKPAESLPEQEQTDPVVSNEEHDNLLHNSVVPSAALAQRAPVKRRKAQKRRRLIGEVITKFIPLPPFPNDLIESLKAGLVYVNQTHTKKMNTFLKNHVRNITNDEYPTVKENQVLKAQVMARIKSMKIPNPEFYRSKIVKTLSASWRNDRNWQTNKRPRYLAAKQMLRLAEITGESSQPQQTIASLSAEDADKLLKEPVRNKEVVIRAITAAASITPKAICILSVQAAMESYPYLKQTDMLIRDFANRVDCTLEILEENFNSALVPLSTILAAEIPQDDVDTAQLLDKLSDHLQVDDTNFPCIQFCDVSIKANEVLDNIPKGQAPALIIVKNDVSIVSAVVVFNQQPLYHQMSAPKAFECVVLLLAVYFVYSIDYPQVYSKTLLTLEYIVCGESRLKSIDTEVRFLFEKLFNAKKLLG